MFAVQLELSRFVASVLCWFHMVLVLSKKKQLNIELMKNCQRKNQDVSVLGIGSILVP